jgi:hypothetical protein
MVGKHRMPGPSHRRTMRDMAEPGAIFLLEAYAVREDAGPVLLDQLRAEIESHAGVRVIGLVGVPDDEAVLCLVAADSAEGEVGIVEIAERHGPSARLLRVSWAPTSVREVDPGIPALDRVSP